MNYVQFQQVQIPPDQSGGEGTDSQPDWGLVSNSRTTTGYFEFETAHGLVLQYLAPHEANLDLESDSYIRILFDEQQALVLGANGEFQAAIKSVATPSALALAVTRQAVKSQSRLLSGLTQTWDALDAEVLDAKQDLPALQVRIRQLRSKLIATHRLLVPQKEALESLSEAFASSPEHVQLSAQIHRLDRQFAELNIIRDYAAMLADQLSALVSERTARSAHLLAVVSTIFLPMNLVVGLFGANIPGVPFANSGVGFYLLSAVLLIVMCASYFIYHRMRWI